jgi:sulfide:quinone oxidoreductase
MRVLVLGAGFGGLELTTRLSDELGDATEIVLIDKGEGFVAAAIIAREVEDRPSAAYDGHGQCYLEFGHDQVARVDVTFTPGQAPSGTFEAPSKDLAGQKSAFGTTRIQRWFGRDWSTF